MHHDAIDSSLTASASINILDDFSLLHVFYLYRPFLVDECDLEDVKDFMIGGEGRCVRERWWCKLAHVCQRWRTVVLGSTAYLGVSLVCTKGTLVSDVLEHLPPLPLVIDYSFNRTEDITTEDEERAILALKQRDRVRCVRLTMAVPSLQKLIEAMDDEYPILEYLIVVPLSDTYGTRVILSEAFQAPHLRHLSLSGFVLPLGCRLLTSAEGLVTLCLGMIIPSTCFHSSSLLKWLSSMPKLEMLIVNFTLPTVNVEGQFKKMPIVTALTLPNLRVFNFRGSSAYLGELLYRITTPRLKNLQIIFLHMNPFPPFIPRFLQFMNATESLRFEIAKLEFTKFLVNVEFYPRREGEIYTFSINAECWYRKNNNEQPMSRSVAQFFNSSSLMFSAVEHLTLNHKSPGRSPGLHIEADRTDWRKLLGTFRNVKTLRVDNGLVEELSRCLQLDNGELPLELLPELHELTYSGSDDTGDAFTSFIDARLNAGRPITLVHRNSSPDPI